MNIEKVVEIIEEDPKVNYISDFMICPITYEIWEKEPVFSLSDDMLKDVFENLKIKYDYDKQEEFVKNNKWIGKIEIDLNEDETIIQTFGKTLDELAKKLLNEFKKIK